MALSAADRENLFGTSVVTYQMQLYLIKCPGGRIDGKAIRKAFADLSKAAFTTAIISLSGKGIISIEGDDVVIDPAKVRIRGVILDRCWKAIRIEKRFTARRIAELTGSSVPQVRNAIREFQSFGAVQTLYRKGGQESIYMLARDTAIRPSAKRARPHKSKVKAAWNHMRKLGSFTVMDIAGYKGISRRYAKDLVQLFRKSGYICVSGVMPDGHMKIFKVTEDAPAEPPKVY